MEQFDVEIEGETLRARLHGELTTEAAVSFRERVYEMLKETQTPLVVIVDLRGLSECGVFARSELIQLQRVLKTEAKRTAYVADVARFRGLAMWVVNIAEDENAKVCISDAIANSWVVSEVPRRMEIALRTNRAITKRKGVKA